LSNLTVSVGTTRSADLRAGETTTVTERITSGSFRAPADGNMVLNSTLSPLATGNSTRIHALVVLTRPLGPAVRVLVTLALNTAGVGITLVSRETAAHRASSFIATLGTTSANTLHTRVGPAAGPCVRTSYVSIKAPTHGSLTAPGAVSVRSTGVSRLAGVKSAGHVGVSNVLGRTLADGGPAIVLTHSALATRTGGAGVEPAVGVGVPRVA